MFRTLIITFFLSCSGLCCPRIDGLIDYNCDGILKIVVTGDSVAAGVRDESPSKGGYVARLQEHFPNSIVSNIGVPGITSKRLITFFKQGLKNHSGRAFRRSRDTDVIIIDIGRNDYWEFQPIEFTVANVKRVISFLQKSLKVDEVSPYILLAALVPNNRSFQRSYIHDLNEALLMLNPQFVPNLIRFDRLDPELISFDGLHPSTKGYDAMFKIALSYINTSLQPQLAKKRRDLDQDGIFDFFELRRFFTDINSADTDADSFQDGLEVFTLISDPLNPLSPGAFFSPSPSPTASASPTATPAP